MQAIFLLGSLKREGGETYSNTHVLCDLLAEKLKELGVESEIVSIVEHYIPPGLKTDLGVVDGKQDEWPGVAQKMFAADIVIFATPIWWGNHSSLMQRVIERMDELNDEFAETGKSPLLNKAGGIVITGAEDGAQHIIGTLANFMSWNGLTLPPAPSLSYLGWNDLGRDELLQVFKIKGSTNAMAATVARNLVHIAKVLKDNPLPVQEVNAQGLN
jgi:multimeric flavodoxin WrbA